MKMRSRTVDMLRMCPREVRFTLTTRQLIKESDQFAWFLDRSMRESIDHTKFQRKLKLEVIPLHHGPGNKEVVIKQTKGKQKVI